MIINVNWEIPSRMNLKGWISEDRKYQIFTSVARTLVWTMVVRELEKIWRNGKLLRTWNRMDLVVCWKNGKEGMCNVLETVWNMKGMWVKMVRPVWHVAFGEAAHSLLSASITINVWSRNPSLGNHPRAFWNYVTWHIEQYRKGEKTI